MPGPIATIGSNHTCPVCSGPAPHVGGPVIQGSTNVLAGGKPVALLGGACICNGPPDAIAQGDARVFVNGLPVATVGSLTIHGGVIVTGEPTVIIGTDFPDPPAILPVDRVPPPETEEIEKRGYLGRFAFSV